MTLIEKICEELGVEEGDLWLGNNGFKYQIMGDGKIRRYTHDGEAICVGYDLWAEIIGGNLKPVWKPDFGDEYFYPGIDFIDEIRKGSNSTTWTGHTKDIWRFNNGLVFRTKEEAIEATNKMLNVLKEED